MRNRAKILLIDDDRNTLFTFGVALKSADYEVVSCSDAADGLNLVETESYDLLIVDNMMPVFSGIELIQRARLLGIKQPAILMSASPVQMFGSASVPEMTVHIEPKPITPERLRAIVQQSLGGLEALISQ